MEASGLGVWQNQNKTKKSHIPILQEQSLVQRQQDNTSEVPSKAAVKSWQHGMMLRLWRNAYVSESGGKTSYLFGWFVFAELTQTFPKMVSSTEYGSHTWDLLLTVDHQYEDVDKEFEVTVTGDLHVGGLMLKLVEEISK